MLKINNLRPDGTLDDTATTRVLFRDDSGVPTGDFAVVELRTLEYYNKLQRKFRRPDKSQGRVVTWEVNSLAVNEALILECLKSWSVLAQDGSPAPMTADAVKALDPRPKQQLVAGILGNEFEAPEDAPTPEESFRESA